MFEFFTFALIVMAAGTPFIILHLRAQREREALARNWAAARGCTYSESNLAMLPYLPGAPAIGPRSKVTECIEGETPGGHSFCSFKFAYQISSIPGATNAVSGAAVMVRLPAVLPELSLMHEALDDKLDKLFGAQDIELESDAFNRLFRVESPNEAFAYGVLHPRMMEWIMSEGRGMVPFYIRGQELICWGGTEPEYSTLDAQLETMCSFVDQIPQVVFEQYSQPLALS